MSASGRIEVHDWQPRWRDDFARLNLDWLERYFSVEEIDRRVLGEPERWILAPGGHIFFALEGTQVVGTGALLRESEGVYELTKMAVDPAWQGRGIGRRILEAAIARFRELRGTRLFLESNRKLAPAIHLYQSLGFVDQGRRPDSHYARSDIYMVWGESRDS
jgi:ribosomal protein S18 acetylase RimI-like enzyme